ncbi:unnamed protein product, partial [Rhizoctonia solani]
RKKYCECCDEYVTTETYKAHLRAHEGLPRLPKKKRLERKRLRQYLCRLSSRESINAYRNRSPPSPQSPKPMDFPNLPSRSPSLGLDLGAIPEVEMDDLWEQVMQSRAKNGKRIYLIHITSI